MEHIEFKNSGYRAEWAQGAGYELGTAHQGETGEYAVYDGKQNFMGVVKADGGLVCNGAKSEYKESFLQAAKAALGL